MDAQNFVVNQGADAKVVKDVRAKFPDFCVSVLFETLIVEAVDLGDRPGFVVAPDEGDTVRVPDFQSYLNKKCLKGIVTPVDVVSKENVIFLGGPASTLE